MKKGKTIREQDEVVFFPSAASWDDELQLWNVQIDGAVFDPLKVKMRKKLMVRLLRRLLDVPSEQLESEIFRDRIRPFTANALKGRSITIRVGGFEIELSKKSKRNGHFSANFFLAQDQVDSLVEEGAITNRMLNFELVLNEWDERLIMGQAHLLFPEGESVISDVDDTIKNTNVGNRKELLKNTFLREFQAIDGMADLFQNWKNNGTDFHFVSASPWQLINPLCQLLDDHQFPAGTFNLRTFRWRDQVFKRVVSEKWVGKAKVIRKFIERFPNRTYVLIGDSVERDPELYAHLAEKFDNQIKAIYIRQVPGFEMNESRIGKIQSQINGTRFVTYESSADLPPKSPF